HGALLSGTLARGGAGSASDAPEPRYDDPNPEGRRALATLPPGTPVDLTEYASEVLRFPPADGDLVIVVHPAALRASSSPHTQVAQFDGDALTWLGALSEELLVTLDADPD